MLERDRAVEAVRMNGGAKRFAAALRAAGAQHGGREVWEELVERYGERWRHYHTLEHVADCLERLDDWKGLAERPEEVELALWFHDAVYVPWKGSNEEKSAELACQRLETLGVPAERRERIAAYILATKAHEPADGDPGLVLDLDLSILGATEDRFDRYEQQIRQEYAFVPRPLFRRKRRALLHELSTEPTSSTTHQSALRLKSELARILLDGMKRPVSDSLSWRSLHNQQTRG